MALTCVVLSTLIGGCGSARVRTGPASSMIVDGSRSIRAEFFDDVIVIEIMINGTGPHRLQLDTGATVSSITPELALDIGLRPRTNSRVVDAHGKRRSRPLADADLVEIGGLQLRDVPFGLSKLPELVTRDSGVVGLAGYNLFRAHTLDIDYPGQAVRISNERLPSTGTLFLFTDGGRNPFTAALFRSPNRKQDFIEAMLIDTGSGAQLTMNRTQAKIYADLEGSVEIGASVSATGSIRPAKFARLNFDLFLGGPTATHVTALLDENPGSNQLGTTELGGDLMRHFRVTIDPIAQRIRFIHPHAPDQVAMPVKRIHGFQLALDDHNMVTVKGISENSPAQHAGLQPGDRILGIDGQDPLEQLGSVNDPTITSRRFKIDRSSQRLELVIGLQDLISEPETYRMMRDRHPLPGSEENQPIPPAPIQAE